ncbi:MAG TPA: dienelactone hydrolase family protein, partial [Chroococcidiopsis sp.]
MAEIKTRSVAIANGSTSGSTSGSTNDSASGSTNGSLQIAAYLAEPVAAGPYPGVIVIQEVFGVNAHIRAVTERLAQDGYVAIAPAIYQRTAPDFEVGYSDEELKLGRYHKELTRADQLLSDIQAAADYLKAMPTVNANA